METSNLHYITLNGKVFPYEINRKKIKNVYFTFQNGRFKVSSPMSCSIKKLESLFKLKESMLYRMATKEPVSRVFTIHDGDRIRLLGEEYTLVYIDKGEKRATNASDIIYLDKDRPLEQLIKIAKEALLSYLEISFTHYYKKMYGDDNLPKFAVKRVKTYYGICDVKKRYISFNVSLAFASLDLIDYVVVHELAHLTYPNHQASFQRLVEKYMPDYRIRRRRLKKEVKII